MEKVKLVATLGPALDDPKVLKEAILAGARIFRLNFSHGKSTDHEARAQQVRACAQELGVNVGFLGDLQGPKIRIGKFENQKVKLKKGQRFELRKTNTLGNEHGVQLDYLPLMDEAFGGDILVLDDGKMRLKVLERKEDCLVCEVLVNGELSNNKGINRLGGGLSASALTLKDFEDIKLAAKIGVDFLAVSFPKEAADLRQARTLLQEAGGSAWIVAKIERKEAIDALEEIIEASDGIMVARGDLALEVGDAAVPALQKKMIALARQKNRFCITATQMLESMIHSSTPTRAEVSDIANAVLDGTDAVMLSAESASGEFPVESIEAMRRIANVASETLEGNQKQPSCVTSRNDQMIALGALAMVQSGQIDAIVALTSSGSSGLWLSRYDIDIPIVTLCHTQAGVNRSLVLRGVQGIYFNPQKGALFEQIVDSAKEVLLSAGVVREGQRVLFTYGEPMGSIGCTDTLRIKTI